MPSPFYRGGGGGGGRSGPGVSEAGFEGAQTLFEQTKGVLGDMGCGFIPTNAEEAASAKAAADAYMSCRNGVSPTDALAQQTCPREFPDVQLGDAASGPMDLGKAIGDLCSNMGDMLNQVMTSPMGMLGSFLSFLFKLFTEIASGIGEAIAEAARAAASAVEEAWKRQMELASKAAEQGVQPLELYTQSATTQTLSHALKNTAST